VESSDRGAYDRWLETNRQLHRANLAFAAGVSECLPESRLLALARDVGQLQEDEGETLKALCVLRASRPERASALLRTIARDRVRVSNSVFDRLTLGS
jgi:predicted HD phosphohydrolase